jgi:hypothetical protein
MKHNLQEELIRDFQEQKKMISEQVELIDPMATSLRKPAARRLFHAGIIVFMEIIAWLLFLGCIAFAVFMDRLSPFYIINQIIHDSNLGSKYASSDLNMLHWGIRGMAAVASILFFIIARMLGAIRIKNSVLHVAGRNMKLLAEQLLKRKAAMEALEQRHPFEMLPDDDSIVMPGQKPHNDILL